MTIKAINTKLNKIDHYRLEKNPEGQFQFSKIDKSGTFNGKFVTQQQLIIDAFGEFHKNLGWIVMVVNENLITCPCCKGTGKIFEEIT